VQEGFTIEHLEDGLPSPVYATARKLLSRNTVPSQNSTREPYS
jgi:hypothetical protein